jgi:hypothetical protein
VLKLPSDDPSAKQWLTVEDLKCWVYVPVALVLVVFLALARAHQRFRVILSPLATLRGAGLAPRVKVEHPAV